MKRKMKDNLTVLACVGTLVLLAGVSIVWTVSIWTECRETNSFGYCLRLISK